VTDSLAEHYKKSGVDLVIGIEARGFIFASRWPTPSAPASSPSAAKKLPGERVSVTYSLEYGTDTLEMHTGAITSGHCILIVDDLLATGGTAAATAQLIEENGGKVAGMAFVVELTFLNGRDKLRG